MSAALIVAGLLVVLGLALVFSASWFGSTWNPYSLAWRVEGAGMKVMGLGCVVALLTLAGLLLSLLFAGGAP